MAKQNRLSQVDLFLVGVILIWGLNFSVVKILYTYFDPLAFNALRFTLATSTLALMLRIRRHSFRLERADVPQVLILGIVSNTLYQFLFVLGLAQTRAGNAALIMALTPIFAYLTGVVLRREPFQGRVLSGILTSLTGVALVILTGKKGVSFGTTWMGDLMILGAALCWGGYTGASAPLIAKYGALRLSVMTMLAGSSVMIPLSLPWIVAQDWLSIPLAGWLAFCYATFLAIVFSYLAWSYAILQVGIARTAVYSNLTAPVALMGAWILLGETPTPGQLGGVAMILTGIFLVRMSARRP